MTIDISVATSRPLNDVVARLRACGFNVTDYGVVEGNWTIRVTPVRRPSAAEAARICALAGVPPLTFFVWREVA